MWIKICANTSLEDAQLAVRAGANAVGFVFAPSPRRVTTAQVAEITPHLPCTVEKFGVFGAVSFEEIVETVTGAGLTGAQLHGDVDMELAAKLRAHFNQLQEAQKHPGRLGLVQVLHFQLDAKPADALMQLEAQLTALRQDQAVDAVLVDSRTATAGGGTGVSFDWQGARRSFFRAAPHLKLIAAGGLNAGNVREAILTLQPWGVDVASGVEAAAGKKDPAKVEAFIREARAAATLATQASSA